MSDFLRFNEEEVPSHWKTKKWNVVNDTNGYILGYIAWWGAWRKYVFHPEHGTIYDPNCLREISKFTEAKTKDHYSKDPNQLSIID